MNDLTLIIPAKNEKESLPVVIDQLKELNCEILISLQKNDEKTINAIADKNVKIFYQSETGYGNALTEAINNCKTKYFCIFNADGSFEKNDLHKMHKLIQTHEFVFTTRYEKPGGSDDDTIITYIGNKLFTKLGNVFFSLKISDILYTFVMGSTESFKILNITSKDFKFCVEMPIKMEMANMKYFCLPSFEKKRIAGNKKVNAFKDGFLILIEMIKLFISYKLLKKKIVKK